MSTIEKAKLIAQEHYKNKTRISGESLYEHVYKAYNLLSGLGITEEDVLHVILLHHIDIKNKENENMIYSNFGVNTVELMHSYNEYTSNEFTFDKPEDLKSQYILESALKLASNSKVLLIRLADKADNITTAIHLEVEDRLRVAKRALYLYAPLAKIIGLGKLSNILEDHSFRILYPRDYYFINQNTNELKGLYAKKILDVKDFIKEILDDININNKISYRLKSAYSIFNKLQNYIKRGWAYDRYDIQKIDDVFALRVIVDTEEACYVVEDTINSFFDYIPEKRDDYISLPKPSGYKSLHNIITVDNELKIEVQIRTSEMHEYNEYGGASHFLYKLKTKNISNLISLDESWLKNLDILESKASSEINILSQEVFTFTPNGDIIKLPKGSTPVDFAYAVHEDIGNKYKGALVNGKIVNVKYQLCDGDRVDILTSNKETANLDWLENVKSFKSKKQIRRYLRKTNKIGVA